MAGEHTTVPAHDGGAIPTYMSVPESGSGPAVVVIVTIRGVKEDMVDYVEDLASKGFCVAAPDPFWRDEDPGVVPGDEEGRKRAFARMGRADHDVNVQDMASVMSHLKSLPQCNGKSAVVGFCFGGLYAFLGAARLGTDAGIAFHSAGISPLFGEIDKIGDAKLSYHWGDQDVAAPMEEIEKVKEAFAKLSNAEVTVYPGAVHGFMEPTNPQAYDKGVADASWKRCLKVLQSI
ncbi:MAG: dienelactone hydrolase family protein [Alphaproteobacteria bacterium]|nr:dienelactone hydrolase family protein [Alphaproteobacteria bacterium]